MAAFQHGGDEGACGSARGAEDCPFREVLAVNETFAGLDTCVGVYDMACFSTGGGRLYAGLCLTREGYILLELGPKEPASSGTAGTPPLLLEVKGRQRFNCMCDTAAFSEALQEVAVVSLSDTSLRVYTMQGELARDIDTGAYTLSCVFSPSDSDSVVCGGAQGELLVCSLQQERVTHQWSAHGGKIVNCVDFSPCGRLLASGGYDNKVCLWRPGGEWACTQELEGHSAPVKKVAFFEDTEGSAAAAGGGGGGGGRLLLLSGSEDGTTRVYDVDVEAGSAQLLTTLEEGPLLSVHPSGAYAATGHDGQREGIIKVWDLHSGKELHSLRGPQYNGPFCFSPDGRFLACGTSDMFGDLRVWDVSEALK